MRPAPYFVAREGRAEDVEFETSTAAEAFANALRDSGQYAAVYERRDLRDVTPDGDPRGLLWDCDDVIIWEDGEEVTP